MWNIFNAVKGWFGGNDDEEEKRKRQQPTVQQSRPTVQQPFSGPPSLTQSTPEQAVPLMPSIVNKPKVEGDVSDLDEGRKKVVNRLRSEGKNDQANEIVSSYRNEMAAKRKSEWDNSFLGKASGFVAGLPKATYDVVTEGAQDLGRGIGTAAAFNSQAVKDADEARARNVRLESDINQNISNRLRDPNIDTATKNRLRAIQIDNLKPDEAKQSYDNLYAEMANNTDPLKIALGALDTATLPLVGGLTAAKAVPKSIMTAADTFVDPLNLLNRVPVNSRLGRVLNADLNPFKGVSDLVDLAPTPDVPSAPPSRKPVSDPTSPISTPTPTAAPKPQAITSPNRPQGLDTPRPAPLVAPEPPVITPPPQALLPEPTIPPTPDPMVEQLARQLEEQATLPQAEVLAPEVTPSLSPLETQVLQAPPPPAIPQSILEQAARAMAEADAPSKTALSNVPDGAMAKISDGIVPQLTPEEVDILARLGEYKSGRFESNTAEDVREVQRLLNEGYAIGDRVGLDVRTGSPRDIDGRILDFLQENEINSRGFRSDGPSPSQMLERNRQLMGDDNLNMVRGRDDVVNGQRVDGYYRDGMVSIVEGKGDLGTVDHEVVHRAFDEFVGPEQRTAILDQIKGDKDFGKTVDDYVKKGYEANPDLIAEEKLADDFMRYAEAKRGGKDIGPLHISPKVLAYFDRVWEGMKSVVGKQDNAKQLYSQLETGKFRNADPTQASSGYTRLKASDEAPQAPKQTKLENATKEQKVEFANYVLGGIKKHDKLNDVGSVLTNLGNKNMPYHKEMMRMWKSWSRQNVDAPAPRTPSNPTVKQPNLSKQLADDKAAIEARRVERNKKRAAIEAEEQADLLGAEGKKIDELFGKQEVPTLRAFGREIPMTPENGYTPLDTPDGSKIYTKTSKVGSNRKGDSTIETRFYDAKGNKLTQAQADAYKNGSLKGRTTPQTGEISDADLEKRFIQLRDYNNSGEISPDELAEFERLTVDRMKRRGTYDDQVNEVSEAVNSGTATIKDVPSVLRKDVEARTNPQTGEVYDIIETPDGPEFVTIKKGTKQTPKEKFAESLEMGEADGVLPTTNGKSKATTGKTVSETVAPKSTDPRIVEADAKATKQVADAKKDGVDYGALVVKVTRNAQSLADAGTLPKDLTSAERKVVETIRKDLNAIVQKTNELGITNEDLGHISGDYLPTKDADAFDMVESAQDVANRNFGFDKHREYKLDDTQIYEGAEDALKNYYRVGAFLDDITPQQVDVIKQEGMEKQTVNMLEGDEKSPVKVTLDEEDTAAIRQSTKKVVEAERKVTETTEKIKKGDKSDDTLSARNQAIKEADEAQTNKVVDDLLLLKKKIDSEIEKTKASTELSPGAKKQRIKQLQERYNTHEYRTRYLQTYTRSNALFQIPGRLADQVNKGVQAISDTTVGVLGRLAENKSFQKAVGRPISADSATVKGVMQNIGDDPRLNPFRKNLEVNKLIADKQSKSAIGRKASRYRIYATAATEAGSNYKGPVRETVSFFAAKAQAEGLTDIGDISRYVQDQINTKEWKRVYGELYRERNAFTGVPLYRRDLDGTIDIPKSKSDAFFTAVDKGIEDLVGKVGITNPRAQREIADMLRIPLVGFPRVMFNLGRKGFDHATLGVRDFYSSSRIVPTDDASALRKALLLRSSIESAAGGAAVGALGFSLGAAGMISGAYPEDPAERARWQEEKKQPYSIKMKGPDGKDQWFDVSRYIGPYSLPLLLGSQMSSGDLSPKDIAGTVGHIAQQVAKNFGTDSVGTFFETSAKALKGDMEGVASELEKFLPNMIGMGIPLSGQLNAFGKLFDDTERSTEGDNFVDSTVKGVQRKIPGARNSLDAKTGAFGDPITENSLSSIMPVSGGQDISGSVKTELSRLAEAGVEAYPGSNTKKYSLRDADGNGIKLKKSQQTDLDNAVKKEKARQADLVMTSETYKKATDQEKGAMLKTLYTLDSSATASEWAKENGIAGVKSVDEKINNSIPRDSQQALIEYKLQGDKKDKWLDDIDNAANYHTANYKNAEANDSLDYDDKNLFKTTSKKYRMVAAQTNKDFGADIDLIKLYENTTKTEFKNMPEGPEKQRLREFDATRAGKGVSLHSSDHNKPKYGAAGGSGSGGRGKTTVSLPSILSASSRGGTSEGYAKGDRLFKPQKALLAPDGTSNTVKVPGISVKRGVHL